MSAPARIPTTDLAETWSDSISARGVGTGPEWLQTLRARAARELRQHGLPGKKDEAWKYTSLRRLEELKPTLGADESTANASDWMPLLPQLGGFGFRVLDGRLQWLEQDAPQGVSIMPLADVFSLPEQDQPDSLRTLLETQEFSGRSHAFEALNTALLKEGVLIHVAAGIDAGLCQAQWGLGSCPPSRLANFRIIVILEAGARLRLVEQFQGVGQRADEHGKSPEKITGQGLNLVLQVQLAADSSLEHVRLQNEAPGGILFTFTEVEQNARSSYTYSGFDIGGGLVRHAICCRLIGQGARTEVNGAFVLDHDRHVDHHIHIDHQAPSCSSDQFFRGVLGGRSRGVFNGKAVIKPGADGSRVRQSNANLLLSELAEIDTKPELEIYADEVEASHGATVGQLDEQAVFYLRSRGLAEMVARRMLTSAFCRAVTARLADTDMAGQIADLLEFSMPGLEPAGNGSGN